MHYSSGGGYLRPIDTPKASATLSKDPVTAFWTLHRDTTGLCKRQSVVSVRVLQRRRIQLLRPGHLTGTPGVYANVKAGSLAVQRFTAPSRCIFAVSTLPSSVRKYLIEMLKAVTVFTAFSLQIIMSPIELTGLERTCAKALSSL